MNQLLTDHAELRRRLDELTALRRAHGLSGRAMEAQVECYFRLAVHSKTSPQEALGLLRKAAALDPANPKHPYHIARLYFVHGEFDLAAEWLRVAAVRCPTSHRIWAHVALLQRELSAKYTLNDAFDGEALLKLGSEINDRIKSGKDAFETGLLMFVPPPSKKAIEAAQQGGDAAPPAAADTETFPEQIERLTNPGECRWSGVFDLEMESAFWGEASKSILLELLPSLETAGRAAARRPDRLPAFVVLAVQWMVSGLPPGSVRRLCPAPLPPVIPAPELELVELVIQAFEAPAEQVPHFLAAALDQGRISPALAAVIHHRRLLTWRPLEFRSAAKIGAARRFLDESRTGETAVPASDKLELAIRKHRDTLVAAVKALRVAPRRPLDDAAPVTVVGAARFDAASAQKQLDRLREDAARLKELKNQLISHILERVEAPLKAASDLAACASAAADRTVVECVRDEIKQVGATGQAKLDELNKRVKDLSGTELRPDFQTGCETCRKDLIDARNVGNVAGILKRIDKLAEAVRKQLGLKPGPASAECLAISNKLAALFMDETPPVTELPAGNPLESPTLSNGEAVASSEAVPPDAVGPIPLERSPLDELQANVAFSESELSAFYAACLADFGAYSPQSRSEPALAELMAMVHRFEADALYRSGRWRAARAKWNGLLRHNRLDLDLMHNLAVADTRDPDPGAGLASWKAYAEVLYFLDVVAGTPRPGAGRRVEFHHQLAGAYGPSGLVPRRDQQTESVPDPEATISFLNDPGRVRNFVGHKLLEFVAGRFDYTSPPILLGTSRGDGASSRKAARALWGTFVEQVAPLFPARIQAAFAGTCQRHLDAALKACESASRLVRRNDPHYEKEQKRHVRWLAEVIELKFRLRNMIYQSVTLAPSLTSIAFLDELVRLDFVPLNTNPDWMLDAARSLFPPKDVSEVVNELPTWFVAIQDPMLFALIAHVFKGPDTETTRRDALYQKLVGPWLYHKAIWRKSPQVGDRPYADLLDDPSAFYPEAVHADLKAESPDRRTVQALHEWCRRYPRSTGPARHLATLLINAGKMDEAEPVLDAAISAAFHKRRRAECESLMRHLTVAKAMKRALAGKLDAADELLVALRADDGNPEIAQQVINGFIILAQATKKDPGADLLAVAVESWAKAARSKLKATAADDARDSKNAALDELRSNRDNALVMIALAVAGGHTKNPDWNRIISEMTDLLRRHSDLKEPFYWRMTAYWELASAASKQKDGAAVRRYAASAGEDASKVIAAFPSTERAKKAGQILEQAQGLD